MEVHWLGCASSTSLLTVDFIMRCTRLHDEPATPHPLRPKHASWPPDIGLASAGLTEDIPVTFDEFVYISAGLIEAPSSSHLNAQQKDTEKASAGEAESELAALLTNVTVCLQY